MKKIITLLLAAAMLVAVLAGCNNGGGSGSSSSPGASGPWADFDRYGPMTPYPERIKITVGRADLANTGLPSGDTLENNLWKTYIEDELNIDIEFDFLADPAQYNTRINLAIASNSLPDFMFVRSLMQVVQLAESGMVADMTFAKDMWTPRIRNYYESYGDRAYSTGTYGGKLMAIPNTLPGFQDSLLWVRSDWMEEYGLKDPVSLEDVLNIATTFVSNDAGGNGNIGFSLIRDVGGVYNTVANMDPIFNMHGAFPRQWVKRDGQAIYGSVMPETKTALGVLADMYAKGLIDKEFALRPDMSEPIANGQSGLLFAPSWIPLTPLNLSRANDPEADWTAYMAPLDSNGKMRSYYQNSNTEWVVVRAGYEYPEAAIKLLNKMNDCHFFDDAKFVELGLYKDMGVNWTVFPTPLQYAFADNAVRAITNIHRYMETGEVDPAFNNMIPAAGQIQNYMDGSDELQDWITYTWRIRAQRYIYEPDSLAKFALENNFYPGTTDTMETKWANLTKLEDEMFLQIIMGEKPLSYFDEFVTQWKAQGGDEITAEVHAMMP